MKTIRDYGLESKKPYITDWLVLWRENWKNGFDFKKIPNLPKNRCLELVDGFISSTQGEESNNPHLKLTDAIEDSRILLSLVDEWIEGEEDGLLQMNREKTKLAMKVTATQFINWIRQIQEL